MSPFQACLGSMTPRVAVMVGLLCLLGGCYEREVESGLVVYRFADWLILSIIVACVIAVPAGWLLRKLYWKIFPFVLLMLPVALGLLLPSLIQDRIAFDDEHFESVSGLWFDPNRIDLRFDDLRSIEYALDPGDDKGTRYDLNCYTRDGQVVVVNVGDLMKTAIDELLDRARRSGVTVTGYPAD
ncbi:MAG: hypothetical protein AAGB26_14450 [Planctomycetota bacterium]